MVSSQGSSPGQRSRSKLHKASDRKRKVHPVQKAPAMYHVGSHGDVLATRVQGEASAAALVGSLAGVDALIMNFDGVEIATPSFLGELLDALCTARGAHAPLTVAVVNLNDEVRENLGYALQLRDLDLGALDAEQVERLGGDDSLARARAPHFRFDDWAARGSTADRHFTVLTHLERLEEAASRVRRDEDLEGNRQLATMRFSVASPPSRGSRCGDGPCWPTRSPRRSMTPRRDTAREAGIAHRHVGLLDESRDPGARGPRRTS